MEHFAFFKENGGNMSYQALNLDNQICFSSSMALKACGKEVISLRRYVWWQDNLEFIFQRIIDHIIISLINEIQQAFRNSKDFASAFEIISAPGKMKVGTHKSVGSTFILPGALNNRRPPLLFFRGVSFRNGCRSNVPLSPLLTL